MEQCLGALGHVCEDNSFADFVRRIRAGDQEAAVELIRQFEPAIRLEVRRRLSDPALYRQFDSVDICQSVMLSFFMRARAGQYELDQPQQLLKLLVAMAQNKLAVQARKLRTQRRDTRREVAGKGPELKATTPGPDRVVAGQDLLREVRRHLTAEERHLTELRGEGRTWPEIAAALGGTPQARRRQLTRALDRVARHLGLDEVSDA
jgi:DNA-directed RNA polymerase specialized sigma24 family protein